MDSSYLLETADFFKGISQESKKVLESICVLKTFKKREMLFMEGELGRSVFLLASGGVQLYKSSPDGKEVVIKIVKPGEIFAEVILFERDDYPVSATAIEESQVYLFPKRQFHSLLDHEAFRNDFIRVLMQKQRYLVDQILNLSVADVEKRFFKFLRDHYGEHEEYSVPLSKKDIAAAIGTLPETMSRLILRLKNEGKLLWEGDHIRVPSGFWEEWQQEKS
jgi:CRP/FNR family transcriptional regulator